jgi:hypothetical protein
MNEKMKKKHTMVGNCWCAALFILVLISGSSGFSQTATSSSSLSDDISRAASSFDTRPLSVEATFKSLLRHPTFLQKWQSEPVVLTCELGNLKGAFTMDDVERNVEQDFMIAGRGTFQPGGTKGWQMASVGRARGEAFEDAKLRFQDIQNAMKQKSGTVVVNSAGAYMPSLANVCLDCLSAFQLPVNLNLYLTAAGQSTSAPPHTDKQDVFVLQTQGRKRWRVFSPPDPALKPNVDPMARGKASDVLSLEELEAPVIDTVLSPGMILYMPAGWPHTTDTVNGIDADGDPSVHLTVGVDTHIWGLNFASAREYGLARSGLKDPLKPLTSSVSSEEYWRLQEAIPVGFKGEKIMEGHSRWSDMKAALASVIVEQLVDRLRTSDAATWEIKSDEEISDLLGAQEVADKLIDHHRRMIAIFANMYADVANKLTDVPRDQSFLRSRPYFDQLESTMSELLAWSKAGAVETAEEPKVTTAGFAVASGKVKGKKGKRKK